MWTSATGRPPIGSVPADLEEPIIDARPIRDRIAEFLRGEVTRRTFRRPAMPTALWSRSEWPTRDVVGERSHLDAIRRLVGAEHRSAGADHNRTATLVPEPDNSFDPLAVAVHIDGVRVGYLSRDDAARYQPVLAQLIDASRPPTVRARIWAADYTDYPEDLDASPVHRFGAGIRLVLDEPHLIFPGNPPPGRPYVLLPPGRAAQVHDTAEHLLHLTTLVGPHGEQWAHATLHPVVVTRPRSSHTMVDVHVDGARIGCLTTKVSGDYLPVVEHLRNRELMAAGRVLVAGNRAAVTVKLYAARAHEIEDAWFDDPSGNAGPR